MIAEIVFAAGCFWGVEKHFASLNGVVDVKSGYVGGNYPNPTYEKVLEYRLSDESSGIINYTEGVLVKYDSKAIATKKLIKSFWEIHDPTQLNGQGNDIGSNYRSAIFYTNKEQKELAFQTKEIYQKLLSKKGYGKIVTQIKPLEKFYPAEEYHQDYLAKNPNGYCPNHSTGVKFEDKKEVKKDKEIIPLGDKEILVIENEIFCPYCEKFKKDVSSHYKGTIPLRDVYEKNLKGFDIKSDLSATPTILFIEDGKEIFAHKGYLNEKDFYKVLGEFKLGKNSESFEVAFNKSTDSRFCKQYDIFKNTPDGVFIDKVSGDILFDTKDRFDSKSGWLSFYKAVDNSTIEKDDFSYGMHRIEVIAKKSGIHLGHVFDEFGYRRFCINATVLEFVPRKDIKK
ncbi:MAG: peptide-methionine (S)-S-oxide reductase [Arcobacter sp.]|nr:MAG: peptide-methionine (S)-S-oxide reductase [Arcobacter sp.]